MNRLFNFRRANFNKKTVKMDRKKILIVEDDKMLCTIFEMFANELGHKNTRFVRTGTEAISACENDLPDLILMDIHLDGEQTGIDTAKIIDSKFMVPIIYITSDSNSETIKNAVFKNTYGFLNKPIYKKSLGIAIEFACTKFAFDNNINR